jgi:FkbM family methyltransferase
MLNNPSDVMNMNQFNLEIADMFYFGGTIEPHYRGQVVCAHACGIKHTLFDDIINMSVASGMEMDNFYAKIIQHMSYNYNPRGQYNVVMLQPFNTIVQNKDFASNIQNRGDLIQLTDMVKQFFKPKTFMEIGSKDGQDTKYIAEYFQIDKDKAYIIEANKYCHDEIEAELLKTPYATLIFGAASNTDGEVEFNCVISEDKELVGVSSIKKSMVINNLQYQQTIVPSFRLENLIKEHNIELLKIDVEGHAYEVLEGIGQQLQHVKAIQIETEITHAFENQKLDEQVHNYLQKNNFVLVDKQRCWAAQYDCLYVHKTLLNQ